MKSDETRQMPDIPPAQMEQMPKMGIEVPMMRDGGVVQRIYITKEMAQRDQPPLGRKLSECKLKNRDRSGNGYRAESVCDGPNMKGTGVRQGTFSSSERFTSTYDFKGSMRAREMNRHHDSSGRLLGGDCGNAKPIGEMARGAK